MSHRTAPPRLPRLLVCLALIALPAATFADDSPASATQPAGDMFSGDKKPKTDQTAAADVRTLPRYRTDVSSLNLTPEQKAKIDDIFAKSLQSLREQVAAELTDDQKKSLDAKIAAENPKAATDHGAAADAAHDPVSPRFAWAANTLDRIQRALDTLQLTDDQTTQVSTLFDLARQKLGELQAGSDTDVQASRDQQQLIQAVQDQLRSILTTAQYTQLLESGAARGGGGGGGGLGGGRGRR